MTGPARFLTLSIIFVVCSPLLAQSTSAWQKIGPPTTGEMTAPAPGEGYMTVSVKSATVYQNSNWWTGFVERNRQAVLTANLTATINNVPVTQTVTGNAVAMNKNNSSVDMGFAGTIVDSLPTTFSNMNMNLQINKTAQDGLQGLINQASQLSTATPPVLAISSQTMQITSLAKSIADFMFKANLLVMKAQTKSPFPIAGALEPGIYVCFAGDTQAEYQQYLLSADKLNWNGSMLTFNNQPVAKTSFFIMEVDYKKTFFNNPLDALNFGASKPWVTLYEAAALEIPRINNAADAASTQKDIQSHLSDANTLLYQDYSFIDSERDAISQAVYNKLNTQYQQRLVALNIMPGSGTTPSAMATNTSSMQQNQATGLPNPLTVMPVISVMDSKQEATHHQIVQNLGMGMVMLPTAH